MRPKSHTLILCKFCGERFTRCQCSAGGGTSGKSFARHRARLRWVESFDANMIRERTDAILAHLREGGHGAAADLLSVRRDDRRVIDLLIDGEALEDSDRRARSHRTNLSRAS